MPDTPAISRSIYERVWREAIAAPPRGPRFRSADCIEVRTITSPADSLARLGEQFSAEALLAAGVAEIDAEGGLTLAAPLCGERGELVALRESAEAEPYELLTPRGGLNAAAAVALLADCRWRRRAGESTGYVYLALSWEDWLWLAAAGQPALLCPGAYQLTVALVRSLATELAATGDVRPAAAAAPSAEPLTSATDSPDIEEPAEERARASADAGTLLLTGETASGAGGCPGDGVQPPAGKPHECGLRGDAPGDPLLRNPLLDDLLLEDAGDPPGATRFALVLTAWSPGANCTAEPPGLAARLAELAQWEQLVGDAYGGIDVIVWRPGAEELRGFELIGRHGDCEALTRALEASVETGGRTLSALVATPPPQNFLEARAAYRRALMESRRGSAELSELQAFQAAYEQQLNRQLVEPLLRWGEDASDPRERTQCAVAAEVCDQFHRLAPLVAAELNAWAVHGELFIGNLRRGGGLQALMIMAKTLGKIVERRD